MMKASTFDFERLIDLIYEAAVVPELWPPTLLEISRAADAAFGSVVTIPSELGSSAESGKVRMMRWTGTPEGEKLIADFAALSDPTLKNLRVTRGHALRHPGFFNDFSLFDRDEIERDPFYRDFLRPRGYGWFAGTIIDSPSGDSIVVSVERNFDRGPVESETMDQLDVLRPHLARATLLALRLGMERAREMTEALAQVGLAAAVLKQGGRTLMANVLFEDLEPDTITLRNGRLRLLHSRADNILLHALENLNLSDSAGRHIVQSIPIPARHPRPPLILHVIPIRGAAHDIFRQAEAIVIVTNVEARVIPGAEVLQGLFDLTPAEARVARRLGQGGSISQIAANLGIARNTVRAQLRAILAKTGMKRQADLTGLLASAAQLPG